MSHRPRLVVAVSAVLAAATGLTGCTATSSASTNTSASARRAIDVSALARLERTYGSSLGVAALDTSSGRRLNYRSQERFPFAATNTIFVAAAVLHESSVDDLGEVVHYAPSDLQAWAPITRE